MKKSSIENPLLILLASIGKGKALHPDDGVDKLTAYRSFNLMRMLVANDIEIDKVHTLLPLFNSLDPNFDMESVDRYSIMNENLSKAIDDSDAPKEVGMFMAKGALKISNNADRSTIPSGDSIRALANDALSDPRTSEEAKSKIIEFLKEIEDKS
jgi:hypothetical protein